jgi:sporulation protein YlmC with PRC-barrel domain
VNQQTEPLILSADPEGRMRLRSCPAVDLTPKESKVKTQTLATVCILALLAGGAALSQEGQAPQKERPRGRGQAAGEQPSEQGTESILRASRLIGGEILSQQGKDIGNIEDIVVEADPPKVLYVIASFDGVEQVDGSRYYALPWEATSPSPGKLDRLTLDVDETTLRDAPSFERRTWPDLGSQQYGQEVQRHFGTTARRTSERESQGQKRSWRQAEESRTGYDRSRGQNQPQQPAGRESERASSDAMPSYHRLSQIINSDVENLDRESLGEISDVALDPQAGNVRYAVLSFGGFLGLGERMFAIPWEALDFQIRDDRVTKVIIDVDRERLRQAPGFESNRWPETADPLFTEEMSGVRGAATPTAKQTPERRPAETRGRDRSDRRTGGAMAAAKGSDLLKDYQVRTEAGQELGKVEDLAVDPTTGRITHVILSAKKVEGTKGKLFPIPWRAVHVMPEHKEIVVQIDADRLRQAPSFARGEWPNLTDPRWMDETSSFYGVESD